MSKPKKGTELYFVKLMQKAQRVMTKKQAKKVLKKLAEHNAIIKQREEEDNNV